MGLLLTLYDNYLELFGIKEVRVLLNFGTVIANIKDNKLI
jgi:hypothetical protein